MRRTLLVWLTIVRLTSPIRRSGTTPPAWVSVAVMYTSPQVSPVEYLSASAELHQPPPARVRTTTNVASHRQRSGLDVLPARKPGTLSRGPRLRSSDFPCLVINA